MAQIREFTSSCIFLLIVAGTSAQQMPKKPIPQPLAANSGTYKLGTKSVIFPSHFPLHNQNPANVVVLPPTQNLLYKKNPVTASPSLYLYLMQDRQQMIKDQKQGWWKDPAQAPGAELFRSIFMTNKNNWLYNSSSLLKD